MGSSLEERSCCEEKGAQEIDNAEHLPFLSIFRLRAAASDGHANGLRKL